MAASTQPDPRKIELSVEDGLLVKSFFDAADAKVEGFRMGMETAKAMFVKYLLAQQKTDKE